MPNIKAEIQKHSKITLKKLYKNIQIASCATVKQGVCPLKGQCLTESIVYQANITANIPGYKEEIYLGVSETAFNI